MTFETRLQIASIVFVVLTVAIAFLIGDITYPVRIVQSGHHEPLFILLGLVLGFTMRSEANDDSISALLFSIGMAVLLLLVGGLDLSNPYSVGIGFALTAAFIFCMLGTLAYLVRALQVRRRQDRASKPTEEHDQSLS